MRNNRLFFAEWKRTVLVVHGRDRAAFLHNFCTQDIKQMAVDQCREAFVLDLRGKVLGHMFVVTESDAIQINSVADQATPLLEHWQRYVIREDVRFVDQSMQFAHVFLFGHADGLPTSWLDRLTRTRNEVCRWKDSEGHALWSIFDDFAGPGWLIQFPVGRFQAMTEELQANGAIPATEEQLAAHRIAARCPWYGIDATIDNLPQELRRDDRAISFTKGCYLGQETVARLDALGHVNRLLVRVKLGTKAHPWTRAPLIGENGREIGRLTSVAWSEELEAFIGLAIVRRSVVMAESPVTCYGEQIVIEDAAFPPIN